MWSPTHVQVLVKKARGLNIKGKNGTNDVFVTIGLGKEKYQTSVKEKATENVEWCEQCELTIPQQGNTAEIVLTVLHRNFLGVDEFLGLVSIPLHDFDVYERPKTKWYSLKCKPGKNKTDYRGELEVRTAFTVKSLNKDTADIGSTSDLRSSKKEKHKGSLTSLKQAGTNLGGSLLSLGTKEKKNLKKLAKSVTNKVEKVGEKAKRTLSKTNLNGREEHVDPTLPNKMSARDLEGDTYPGVTTKYVGGGLSGGGGGGGGGSSFRRMGSGKATNRDPGVQSDDEDDDMFRFDQLSHRSSGSSINVTTGGMGLVSKTSTPMSGSLEKIAEVVRDGVERPTDLLRRTFGTPMNGRKEKELTPQSTPRSSRSLMIDAGVARKTSFNSPSSREPVLDEWEAKLLGKRSAVPYKANDDALSQHSQFSLDDKTNSLKRIGQDPDRQKAMAIPEETPSGRKKIIPVGSDFESSPSPESPRGSANMGADTTTSSSTAPSPFKKSPTKSLLGGSAAQSFEAEDDVEKKRKSIGLKLKTSYSFKDKQDDGHKPPNRRLNTSRDLRLSNESLGSKNHSRNHSDSGSNNSNNSTGSGTLPPSGQRVVLGRETTPTPGQGHGGESALSSSPRDSNHNQSIKEAGPTRIPKDVWQRFEGASREDLIEMVVNLQHSVEKQAKVQSDLEDYIDSLLSKVISNAPDILQKNAEMNARFGTTVK